MEVCNIARVLYRNWVDRLKPAPARLGWRHLSTVLGVWDFVWKKSEWRGLRLATTAAPDAVPSVVRFEVTMTLPPATATLTLLGRGGEGRGGEGGGGVGWGVGRG